MSFIDSVGSLMADSGILELMADVFTGVPKMLKVKRFPQNMSALRMVADEIFRSVFNVHLPKIAMILCQF